jgi:ubiquinone/menaquinone biosynthesis C-methylase UbiE
MMTNPIVETYSRLAADYDSESNSRSCWARASEKALKSLILRDEYRLVVDVGCGPGQALTYVARHRNPATRFVGLEPAPNMRVLAQKRTHHLRQVQILDGSFEHMPLQSHSVDYLFSMFAFHWSTDLDRAVSELARVLHPRGEIDLFFAGRHTGREFIRKTSSIFLKYMGPALFIESTKLRQQLTKDDTAALFAKHFTPGTVAVEERDETYYDTLEGHLRWWVRIEGQFLNIPVANRARCDDDVRQALAGLQDTRGIPYTIHELHVKVMNTRGPSSHYPSLEAQGGM